MLSRALTVVTVIATSVAGPSDALAQAFTSSWNADSGLFPDEVSPPWSLTDTAEPEDPFFDSGLLIMETSENAENILYIQTEPLIEMSAPLVVEARVRFIGGSTSTNIRATGFIAVTTAPEVGIALFIGQGEIFLTAAGNTRGMSASVDTDDALHDYRMEIAADGSVSVLYDGASTLAGSTWMSSSNHGPNKRVLWGEGSTLAQGSLAWESVRHSAEFAICGDANRDRAITASDALTILRAGVGQPLECPAVRCDTNSSGALASSDALLVLQFAVGQNVVLDCPLV